MDRAVRDAHESGFQTIAFEPQKNDAGICWRQTAASVLQLERAIARFCRPADRSDPTLSPDSKSSLSRHVEVELISVRNTDEFNVSGRRR